MPFGGLPYNERFGFYFGAISGGLTQQSGTVVLSNSNGVSFGMSVIGSSNIITMSASNAGAGGVTNISAGTTHATAGTVVFSNANAIVFGASAQSITADFASISYWNNKRFDSARTWSVASGSAAPNLSFQHASIQMPIAATELDLIISMTNAGSTAGSYTISAGIYTWLHSTASLASSASMAVTWNSGTNTGAASIYGGQSNGRWQTIGLGTWNLTPGEYLLGFMVSISGPAGSTPGLTMIGHSSASVGVVGGGNMSSYWGSGGLYSAGTGAFPSSIQLSQLNQTNTSSAQLTASLGNPYVQLAGTF